VRALRLTVDTKFHIDLKWWERQRRDIRVLMRDLLCAECQGSVGNLSQSKMVDMVEPETAEVARVDAIWETIRTCCGGRPDYITADTPLLDSIFRVFLANGNKPLSVRELYAQLDKTPPETMLRVLTKGQVYLGIRLV